MKKIKPPASQPLNIPLDEKKSKFSLEMPEEFWKAFLVIFADWIFLAGLFVVLWLIGWLGNLFL